MTDKRSGNGWKRFHVEDKYELTPQEEIDVLVEMRQNEIKCARSYKATRPDWAVDHMKHAVVLHKKIMEMRRNVAEAEEIQEVIEPDTVMVNPDCLSPQATEYLKAQFNANHGSDTSWKSQLTDAGFGEAGVM